MDEDILEDREADLVRLTEEMERLRLHEATLNQEREG